MKDLEAVKIPAIELNGIIFAGFLCCVLYSLFSDD